MAKIFKKNVSQKWFFQKNFERFLSLQWCQKDYSRIRVIKTNKFFGFPSSNVHKLETITKPKNDSEFLSRNQIILIYMLSEILTTDQRTQSLYDRLSFTELCQCVLKKMKTGKKKRLFLLKYCPVPLFLSCSKVILTVW